MAMLYGEGGPRAFYRLQEEIMKSSTDQSILAWTPIQPEPSATTSVLADSPAAFSKGSRILSIPGPGTFEMTNRGMTNRGLRIAPRLFRVNGQLRTALLNCVYSDDPTGQLGIRIILTEDDSGLSTGYSRVRQGPVIVPLELLKAEEDIQSIEGVNTDVYSHFNFGYYNLHPSQPAKIGTVKEAFDTLETTLQQSFREIKKYIQRSERDIYVAHVTNRIPRVKDGNIYCSFNLKTAAGRSMVCPTISSTGIEGGKIYTMKQPAPPQTIDLYITELQTDQGPDSSLCRIGLSPRQDYSSKLIVTTIGCKCGDAPSVNEYDLHCGSCGVNLHVTDTSEIISSRLYNTIDIDLKVYPPQDVVESSPKKKWKLWYKLQGRH